jgi:hypothetical protein
VYRSKTKEDLIMRIEDMKQFEAKAPEYSGALGEMESDMKDFMAKCDESGDMFMHQRFVAAKILMEKANEQIIEVLKMIDEKGV